LRLSGLNEYYNQEYNYRYIYMKKQRGGSPRRRSGDNTREIVDLLHEIIWEDGEDDDDLRYMLNEHPHLINREANTSEHTIYGSEGYTPIMTAITAEDDHRSFKVLMEPEYVKKIDFMAKNKDKINVLFLAIFERIQNVIGELLHAEPRLLETKYKGATPIQHVIYNLRGLGPYWTSYKEYLENTLILLQKFYDMYHLSGAPPLSITRDGVPTRGLIWATGRTRRARRRSSPPRRRATARRARSQSPRRRATARRARSQSPRRRPGRVNITRNARSNSVGRRAARRR
jgi:hypothetical protein